LFLEVPFIINNSYSRQSNKNNEPKYSQEQIYQERQQERQQEEFVKEQERQKEK
jgi:hypothetical protein